MTIFDVIVLLFAGFLAGVMNAIAGGGTLITFPAMISTGLSPLTANASSALAVWPGHAVAAPAAWRSVRGGSRGLIVRVCVALVGGTVGASLLLLTGERLFAVLVPWLLLTATLLFAFGPQLQKLSSSRSNSSALSPMVLTLEFAASIYGGYFGAGLGILLMAMLIILEQQDLRAANALKNLLASIVTSIAVVIFIVTGAVSWQHATPALVGALIGGVFGARIAERVPTKALRAAIIGFGFVLTTHFMIQGYW